MGFSPVFRCTPWDCAISVLFFDLAALATLERTASSISWKISSTEFKNILKNMASKITKSALTFGLPAGQVREVCLFAWEYYQCVASSLSIVSSSSSSCRKRKKSNGASTCRLEVYYFNVSFIST